MSRSEGVGSGRERGGRGTIHVGSVENTSVSKASKRGSSPPPEYEDDDDENALLLGEEEEPPALYVGCYAVDNINR